MTSFRASIALLAGVLVAAMGCGHQEAKSRYVDRYPSLETIAPTRTLMPVRIELLATVEPLEKAELCARIPGVVKYLPLEIDIGRRVNFGETLIVLDVPDLVTQKDHKAALLVQAQRQEELAEKAVEVARTEVVEAEKQEKRYAADFAFAKVQYERIAELVRRNSVTVERGQEVQRQLESAEAAWDAQRAQVVTKKAKQAASEAEAKVATSRVTVADRELKNVEKLIEFATIKAPFDGVITKRWVDRGATVKDAGAPLLTVMNTNTVRVLLDIPHENVPLVTALEGKSSPAGHLDPVELRIPSLRELDNRGVFTGTVTRVSGALDPSTRTLRTEVHLKNPEGHLKPGMYGTARITLAERPYVLTVPATALVRRGDEVGVYVVSDLDGQTQRGVVKWNKIDLGLDDGALVEVRKGLTGTEAVIAKGNGVVREGDTVRAVPLRKPD